MIPARSPESASDFALRLRSGHRSCAAHPAVSAYYARLHPWLIIRHLPQMQRLVVARFRQRPEAEAHLRALRQLAPAADYRILFDPGEADTEY